jgi:3-oxo-5-alpha-steroid 4-dehydrogenase 1
METISSYFQDVNQLAWVMIALCLPTFAGTLIIPAPFGRYSHRSWGPLLPALPCWIAMEAPNLVAVVYFLSRTPLASLGFVNITLLAMFTGHYFNRTIVYPLRQTNRKPMPLLVPLSAFAFTSFNGYLQCKSIVESAAYAADYHLHPQFIFGTVLFLCGMFTNIQSDNILLNLRQPGDSSYKIPRGGLFEHVSGANYTGEIMEWLGFAIAAGTLPAAAFAAYTFSNIAPRAHKHHLWYLEKFEDYPKGRKAVIPGVW